MNIIIAIIIIGLGLLGAKKALAYIPRDYSKTEIILLTKKWGLIYGIDSLIIEAVIQVESNYNPKAVNPADPSYGLMQILHRENGWSTAEALLKQLGKSIPENLEEMKEYLFNPNNNIELGGFYIKTILNKYGFDNIDIYNIGETSYSRGYRNIDYKNKVHSAYFKLKG